MSTFRNLFSNYMASAVEYIKSGDFEAAKNYINAHPEQVNERNSWDETCLMVACKKGNLDLINLLIDKGADIDMIDKRHHETALHYAVKSRELEAVTILLKCGSKINRKNNDGETPLHLAARPIFTGELFVDDKQKPQFFGEWNVGVEALLQSEEVQVNQQNNIGRTPLHVASLHGCTDTVGLLLNRADINANVVDKEGNTPLHLAVRDQKYDVVTLMLSQDSVKFEIKNKKNRTPLLDAVATGHIGIMNKLITKGAKVNDVDNEGNICLHLTVQRDAFHSEKEHIYYLDKWALKLSLKKKDRLCSKVVAGYLFEFGANFYKKNKNNRNPLDLIEDGNLKERLKSFLPPMCTYCEVNYSSEFRPCGHSVFCNECYINTKCRTCPRCRRPISGIGEFESPKFKEKGVQTVAKADETPTVVKEVLKTSQPVARPKCEEEEVQTVAEAVASPKSVEKGVQTVVETVETPTVVKEVLTTSQPVESPKLKETDLLRVATRLGSNWWQVGIFLGIEISEREIEDDSHDTVKQGYLVLYKWFTSCDPETRTRETLTAALEEAGCLNALQCLS